MRWAWLFTTRSSIYRTRKRAASTWVGVTGLVDPSLGVEIECTQAVIASDSAKL